MSRRLTRPSPALVISIMALVVAIVVPAYAALTKKDKNQVKNIANTEITKRAPGLTVSSAKTAGNADLLDGQDSADIKSPTPEATKTLTSFENEWQAFDQSTAVRYWKDPWGVVHLEGGLSRATAPPEHSTMFLLPDGYRPEATQLNFAVVTTGAADFNEVLGYVNIIGPTGQVNFEGGNQGFVSLDGITFRAR